MYDLNGMVAEKLLEMGYGYGDFTILEDSGFIAKLREAINYFVATGKSYELAFHVAFGLMAFPIVHYGIDSLRKFSDRPSAIVGVNIGERI